MTARSPSAGLTRLQKRLLVYGRLVQPDAGEMSDRAIARELGVSQPFVSGLRRQTDLARCPEQPIETVATSERASPRPTDRDVRGEASPLVADERTTSPQEWLDRYHDEHSLLGRVRRVAWSVGDDDDDVSHALRDGDPFA